MKGKYNDFFSNTVVVDFGSLDVNGSNRSLFTDVAYTGVDLGDGPNVSWVGRAHQYFPARPVDVVISTEKLEHDEFWDATLRHAYRILKKGGLLLFTCAAAPRAEHGTKRTTPEDAPFIDTYYRNLSVEDVLSVFDLEVDFSESTLRHNPHPGDLYFCGVKK
jgi:SAM-dependent methyltransferase